LSATEGIKNNVLRVRVVLTLSLIKITFAFTKLVTYSVKYHWATLISAFAFGVKFKVLNAVLGHARHLGHRYSPTGYEPKDAADLSD